MKKRKKQVVITSYSIHYTKLYEFTRKGGEKDDRAHAYEEREMEKLVRDQDDEIRIIMETAYGKMRGLLLNKVSATRLTGKDKSDVIIGKKKKLTGEVLDGIPKVV